MTFESKITKESTVCPGVKFTVRRLNVIQRAKRDLPIAEHYRTHNALNAEYWQVIRDTLGDITSDPDWRAKLATVPRDKQDQMLFAQEQAERVYREHIAPVIIRAGLIAIDGLTLEGQPATVESLIEFGPDELIEEIHDECKQGAGLSGEQQKNLQSPGTLAGQDPGNNVNGSAVPVVPEASTESTAAETAAATSPAI